MITQPPDSKIYAVFDGDRSTRPLPVLCKELLSDQKKTWPDLKEGHEFLRGVRVREIKCSGFNISVQHNHGRARSVMADVGEKGIRERPCFLCLDNLPEGQKGVFYREEYLILCNPMPVLSGHFTISHLDHRPQAIVEYIDTFLQLMIDFGRSWTVLYNGPRCGASAPDHLHFQAIPSGKMPVEKEILAKGRLSPIARVNGVIVSRAAGIGREMVLLDGDERATVAGTFKQIVEFLRRTSAGDDEPMMSIAGFHDGKKWRIMVFPRAKHRPDAFFREGEDRLAVSPGVIEMGGILVAPVEKDFERLDAPAIERIYSEVSLKILLKNFLTNISE
jgi:hypothetical protein